MPTAIWSMASKAMPRSAVSRAGESRSSKCRPRSGARPRFPSTSISVSSGACPRERGQWRGCRHHHRTRDPGAAARRHPRAPVHPPSRRLRRTRRDTCIRVIRPRSTAASRSMSVMAATSPIAWRARRSMPASCRIHWAPTCTATTPTFRRRPARPPSTPTTKPIRSPAGEVQPDAGDELHAGARPHARAGRADGDVQRRRHARPRLARSARCVPAPPPMSRCSPTSAADSSCRTTRRRRSSRNACCNRCSACARASATTPTRRSCRRRWPPELAGCASVADLTFLPALRQLLRRNVKSKATLESYGC